MKRLYTLIILVPLMLFAFTSKVQASVPGLPDDEILYGDANNDGIVNILDIITIINYIMGGNPDPFNFEAADVNNDGVINILDVIFDVNVVMETPGTPCAGFPTVLYEGQTYNTVQIGDQCWFKENLNVGIKINSTQEGFQQTDNDAIEKYCYNNDEANCDVYGGLYEWPEAMQYVTTEGAQGICPAGWHIPTDNEWKILEGTIDSQYPVGDPEWNEIGSRGFDAGGNLKETGYTYWISPNTGATNSSGFTSLPGGYRWGDDGNFYNLGEDSDFWSSSENSTYDGWYHYLYYDEASSGRDDVEKKYGFSVRCLKGGCVSAEADAGEDATICQGTTYTLADATASNYATLLWITSGTGSFNDPTLLNPIYTPSQADIASGEIELTLIATGQGGCPDAVSTMILTITHAPTVNAGEDTTICVTQASYTLSGTATCYSTLLWATSGTGTFNDSSTLAAVYTPSEADKTAGQVTLTLTANGYYPCTPVSDAMTLTIWPPPTMANAGPDQLNITDTITTLAGNIPTFGTGVWHIISGSGGSISDTINPTSTFTGVADSTYSLTWTITSQCGSSVDTVVISFGGSMGQPCPGIPTVEYEGQVYNTVKIGDQCWFKENLNVGTMIISNKGWQLQTDNDTIEKYCYNNDESNCVIYGGLYEWPEAMQYVTTEGAQGICPAGWHIPTDGEYTVLTDYLGDFFVAGGKMKSTGTIEEGTGLWHTPNMGATNSSGFTGLPGSCRVFNGNFYTLGDDGHFWSSSQDFILNAWGRGLHHDYASVYWISDFKENGFSVRCLKGCWPQPNSANAGPDQVNVPGTSTTLAGNTPTYGTGVWHIISGTGGTIADTTNPTSTFTGVADSAYSLTWTITTQCGSSTDEVVISFFCTPPTQSNAGPDQVNVPGTSTTLAGNTPTFGTGVWHIISGTGGIVADTTNPTSTFTGVADSAYSLTWTIATQCGSSTDEVVISFICTPPTQSNAGPDQVNVLGTSTTLAGNTPTYGTGVWHIISGTGGIVADTTNPTSTFTGVADSAYSLTWTITTQCGSSADTVVISFAAAMG